MAGAASTDYDEGKKMNRRKDVMDVDGSMMDPNAGSQFFLR